MKPASNAPELCLGRHFGLSVCEHFGLPSNQVSTLAVNAGLNKIFSVTIDIALTADDLEGIAAKLHQTAGEALHVPENPSGFKSVGQKI